MAQLKAGSIDDFANSMAERIEEAMQEEWRKANGERLGGPGDRDRRVLFAAIAKGVLRYLYEHRDDLVTNAVAHTTGSHLHEMRFDLRERL